ncbi:hypothetical protein G5B47_21020 [Paenibacillus sp. 7124]|uniref:Uncharacterized protein n=1 Tax=Paenibacillus apii TaxID=1850370 RepID=A0A6M1PQU3_9BACL|nr:hypothetical protein [Paenibacillus apii]NGM84888.1 hypothetical protein [Paenibacillus apii]NJJ41761.1 hypothetical protein [Paenibacillus apii]
MKEYRNKKRSGSEEDEDLVTERDIDEEFGLFQEGTFPDALPDRNQIEAVRDALPKEAGTQDNTPKRS